MNIRPYQPADRPGVRRIYGEDEFARPELQASFPGMCAYLADSMAHYYDLEPESTFVAEADGEVVGALLGAADSRRTEERLRRKIKPRLVWRTLLGAYGLPGWLPAEWLTHLAGLKMITPELDLARYPAHLHIGILPKWRRQGLGGSLMAAFENHLRTLNIAGYHLHASSFHPLGVAFYQKLGLEVIGQFEWRLHNGYRWIEVLETRFARYLGEKADTAGSISLAGGSHDDHRARIS